MTSHKSDEGKTILHMMAEQCMEHDLSEILRILVEQVCTRVFIMSPNRRGGHIVFGADPVGVGGRVSSFPCVISSPEPKAHR